MWQNLTDSFESFDHDDTIAAYHNHADRMYNITALGVFCRFVDHQIHEWVVAS